MNIFVLDENPILAAKYHCDMHVEKMIMEATRMLSSAHIWHDGQRMAEIRVPGLLVGVSHANHPCAIWTRKTSANYLWHCTLLRSLLDEYILRYNRTHAYSLHSKQLSETLPKNIVHADRTPFYMCMTIKYLQKNAVSAYRAYYFNDKKHFATWKAPAQKPQWWIDMEENEFATETRLLGKSYGQRH